MAIIRGDARSIPLRDGCVQTCVTSPPYWGLRDYSVAGQIGLEPTPEEFVREMVAVFREVRRVLKADGTVWLNLGDSYAGGGPHHGDKNLGKSGTNKGCSGATDRFPAGLKSKDLCGMPWRVAFALQADGWWLRSDIIWAKPNPMPESVTDRPTRSHEYIFLLAKSERYFFDATAIAEPATCFGRQYTTGVQPPKVRALQEDGHHGKGGDLSINYERAKRNARSVWTVATEPVRDSHFATFPQKLVEPCILAGTSAKGECSRCGANWVREVERVEGEPESYHNSSFVRGKTGVNGLGRVSTVPRGSTVPVGWRPTCSCDAPVRPNLVFDPFLGSGTIGIVCERFGRRWAGTELSEDYIEICKRRTRQMGLFTHA